MRPLILLAVQKRTSIVQSTIEQKTFVKISNFILFWLKYTKDLNSETKIVGICLRLSEIYYFKAENTKVYDSNFEPLLSTFSIGLFSLIVCLHIET